MRRTARYGWVPDRPDKRDVRFTCAGKVVAVPSVGVTPDWSEGMPPAFDQGNAGTCTGNMFASQVVFLQRRAGQGVSMPSRLFSYWVARMREGTTAVDAGAQIRDIIAGALVEGICAEELWPYDLDLLTQEPARRAFEAAQFCEILEYQRVDNTSEQDLVAAMLEGPLCFGATLYESFESEEVSRTGMPPMPSALESVVGGHALWLCQLDLVRRLAKVRNSWGTRWGRDGYCWFPIDYLLDGDLAADFWLVRRIST